MKWNFLYQIRAASRTPDYHPQTPVLSVLNWICWTPPNKVLGTPLVRIILLHEDGQGFKVTALVVNL